MKISDITSLGRVIDPRYPTNLAILLISILAGGVVFGLSISTGEDFLASIIAAFPLGISVFLTWAIGREIDPEHDLAAFVGLLLVIPGYWLLGTPDLVMVLTVLLLLRMLTRTTGLQPKLLDSFTILAFGTLLVLRGNWFFGFVCAVALFLDSRLPEPGRQNLFFSGLMIAITLVAVGFLQPPLPQFEIVPAELAIIAGSILLFIPLIIQTRKIGVICDFQPEKLNPIRVQAGQILAITVAVISWLLAGRAAFTSLLPLWSSLIGLSLAYLSSLLVKYLRNSSPNH
jgi:hypothetical protein